MEINRLILFVLAALALVFSQYILYIAAAALAVELNRRYRRSKIREGCDKQALELLFHLGAHKQLTENIVSEELQEFPCFERFSHIFERTSRLSLPNFGWRSFVVAAAIRSTLETGNVSIITKALEQISRREEAVIEAKSMMTSQKYTLIASIAIASAILGVASSISGQSYVYYVLAQSFVSAIWLKFIGGNFYESLSLSVPLSLVGYFFALRFV